MSETLPSQLAAQSTEMSSPLPMQQGGFWTRLRNAFTSHEVDLTLALHKAEALIVRLQSKNLKASSSESGGCVRVFLKVDPLMEMFPNTIIVSEDGSIYMPPHQGTEACRCIDTKVYAAIDEVKSAAA